jgi:hypothetical protein
VSDEEFRLRPPELKLAERDVVRTSLELLRWHHYYPLRLQCGRFILPDRAVVEACRRVRVPVRWTEGNEAGTPDYALPHLFFEFKRPGGKLREAQEAKIAELRDHWHTETLVIADPDELAEWLARNPRP